MRVDTQAALDKLRAGEVPSVSEVNGAMRNLQTIHILGQLDEDTYKKSMDFYGKLLVAAEAKIKQANPSLGTSLPSSGGAIPNALKGDTDKAADWWLNHAIEGVH